MSINIYKIHIQTNKVEALQEALANWLCHTHRNKPVICVGQNSIFPFFNHKIPSLFALSILNNNWITVLHDAYEPPFELADMLSDTFDSTVIQTMGQSTVDSYCLSVHDGGRIIRKIMCNEDTIGVVKEGGAFMFEKSFLQVDDDNDFFDYEDMNDYCTHFGFELLTDPSENDGHWIVIKVKE